MEGYREIEALNAAGRSLKELYFLQNSEEEIGSILEIQTRKQVACFELAEEPMRKISYRGRRVSWSGLPKLGKLT